MTGIINFFRANAPVEIVGKLIYLGGEEMDGKDEADLPLQMHFLTCPDPDVSPNSCECKSTASYSNGSFVSLHGDDVYNISEVESALLKYYNEIAPEDFDPAQYRPFRWTTMNSGNPKKYKTVKLLLDKDGDVWYGILELTQPMILHTNYIGMLRDHFEDN